MKTILLAGGLGTRISEKTGECPKPMIEIGKEPILVHIMRHYAAFDQHHFVVALGYKGEQIKEYFYHYYALNNDLSIDLKSGVCKIHEKETLDWSIDLVDTGQLTQTGGRLKRLQNWVGHERFMMTYGDGLCDVDIGELLAFHQAHGKLATVLSVRPPARFGELSFEGERISRFCEKPQIEEGWINGGYFVMEPEVFSYIEGDEPFERGPLERLAAAGELMGFRHDGFWQPMDTLREWRLLQALWDSGKAPWAKEGICELLV